MGDFELWWLLPIPALFFAMGWIAARIDIKHLLRESRALPLSYFRGLNFLLNEQPDKAIESFIEVVKVDPQTVDLHFALGSLFRRQSRLVMARPGSARCREARSRGGVEVDPHGGRSQCRNVPVDQPGAARAAGG